MKRTERRFSGTMVLVGTVLLMCSVSVAETYYVSLKGDDAKDGRTEKSAFRTIKKGVSVVQAGDTLIIKSGDYGAERAVLKNSGRKGAPILIKAEKPGEVVLTGKRRGVGLTMIDKSHVVVEGLKFTRYGAGLVIKHRSSYVTVRRCIFLNNENAGIVLNDGGLRDPKLCHHHLFTENQFLDPLPSTQDYGLRMYFSSNVEVVNNYFHGFHHQACSFKAIMTDSRVANNVFEGFHFSAIQLGQNSDSKRMKQSARSYRLIAEGNIFRPSPPYRAKSAIVASNVTDAIVRNNFIDSTYGEDQKGPGRRFFPGAGIQITRLARGTKIYGNVLVNIKAPKPAFMIRSDCEIYNNTVVGCARVLDVAVGVKAVVRNNIFYKNAHQVGVAEPLQPFYDKYYGYVMNDKGVMVELPPADPSVKSVFDYNLWLPDWNSKGPGGISADPRFIGPIKPLVIQKASAKYVPNFERMKAYRLTKSSPCIDKGVKTGLPFTGRSPDIGAFEFGAKAKGRPMKGVQAKCVKCGEEWGIEPKDARSFRREMGMGGAPVGGDCPKCGAKKSVFLMNRCPKCGKYYLSKRITDPDAFAKGGNKEICPHCGTDLYKWYKKRRRRR